VSYLSKGREGERLELSLYCIPKVNKCTKKRNRKESAEERFSSRKTIKKEGDAS